MKGSKGKDRGLPVSGHTARLLAVTMLALSASAIAQDRAMTPAAGRAVDDIAFDISSQSLPAALGEFARQSGLQISAAAALTAGRTAPAVSGRYAPMQALQQLLSGSGLLWRMSDTNTVVLEADPAADAALVLDPVRVEGRAGVLRDQPYSTAGSLSVITREDLEKVPVTSARDVFAETPGVWVMDGRQNPGININIRGIQGPGRNNVMIDGTRQNFGRYGGYNGLGSQVYIDPELIADVIIEKGATSGVHGAGTIGGVVNLRTLEADDLLDEGERYGVQLRGSSGTDNFHGSGSVAGAWRVSDTLALTLGVAGRHTGNYSSGVRDPNGMVIAPTSLVPNPPVPGGEVPHTHQKAQSALFKADLDLAPDQSLKFGGTWHENEYSYDRLGFSGVWGTQTEGRAYTVTTRYAWEPKDSTWFDLRANVWLADSKDEDDSQGGLNTLTNRMIRTTGFELYNTSRFTHPWSDVHFTYGGEYFQDDGKQTKGLDVGGKRTIGSVFLQSRWLPFEWMYADAGVRYDSFNLKGAGEAIAPLPGQNPFQFRMDKGDSRVNPSLALSVMPMYGVQLYTRYAEGLRPPVLSEAMMSGQAFLTPIAPNFDLEPEVSKGREYGLNLRFDGLLRADDKLRFKATYFDNRYEEYIRRDYTRQGSISVLSFENLDRARLKGWELQGGYDLGSFYANAGYTHFTKMQFCDEGSCEGQVGGLGDWGAPYIPPTRKVTADVGTRLLEKKLVLGARMRYDSDIADTSTQEDYSWRWKGYRLYDFYGSYEILADLKLSFSVENQRDKYYVDALSGGRMPGPGRNTKFSISYQF